jgi:hypothetical protein
MHIFCPRIGRFCDFPRRFLGFFCNFFNLLDGSVGTVFHKFPTLSRLAVGDSGIAALRGAYIAGSRDDPALTWVTR